MKEARTNMVAVEKGRGGLILLKVCFGGRLYRTTIGLIGKGNGECRDKDGLRFLG